MGPGAGRFALDGLYPGITDYTNAEHAKSPEPKTSSFKWWSILWWEAFFFIPLQKVKKISDSEIDRCTLSRLFLLREACSMYGEVQGFLLKRDTPAGKDKAIPKEEVPKGDIQAIRDFLHQKRGFSKVIN